MVLWQETVLNQHSKEHMYVQLYKIIKEKISTKEILPDEKLPPIRDLAQWLHVNKVTVINAYKLLEQHRLVYKKVGSGTYVYGAEEQAQSQDLGLDQRFHQEDAPQAYDQTAAINLASSNPTDYLFPVETFKEALVAVLDRDKGGAFGYQDSRGYLPLRTAITTLIKEDSGIFADPDDIQILSGAQQGIDLVAKAMVHYGDVVIVEAPTYTGAIAAFKSRGARILEIPVLSDGPDLMKLRALIYQHKPKLFYTMPNFQNPTGIVYSEEKRRDLLALCYKHQIMLIEDDYCSDLNFSDQKITPLKALDTEDLVVYVKSFSKVLMPGLRLGFMIAPKRLKQQVIMAKQSTDIATSGLTQRAFEQFLVSGAYKEQRQMIVGVYRARFLAAKQAIQDYLLPYCEVDDIQGGLNFWLKLKNTSSARTLYERLKESGILIAPGDAFYYGKNDSPYFRITVASLTESDLIFAIRAIQTVLKTEDMRGEKTTYQPFM